MSHKSILFLGALLLGGVGMAAQAAEHENTSERLGDITPYSGTYIDWSAAGVSLEWDAGPVGEGHAGFVLFHTYGADGAQINWIGQPEYVPTSNAERIETGVIGRASGEFYYATHGPCIGCAPTTPDITHTGIQFQIEWTAPRFMRLKLSGAKSGQFKLDAVNYASQNDGAFLAGTWAATAFTDLAKTVVQTDRIEAVMAVVKLVPFTTQPVLVKDSDAPAGTRLPPASAEYYQVECTGDAEGQGRAKREACAEFFRLGYGADPRDGYLLAWYDPVSKRAGLEAAKFSMGAFVVGAKPEYPGAPNSTRHADLYVSPNLIQGRLTVLVTRPDGYVDFNAAGLTMVRLPDGTVRSQYDYPKNP